MGNSRLWVAVIAGLLSIACQAQEAAQGTLGGMLNAYARMLENQCPARATELADARAKGDVGAMLSLGQLYQVLCVCHQEKVRSLLKSLPSARLAAPARGENDFQAVAIPAIQEPCAGEQVKRMFDGKTCDGFRMTDIRTGIDEAAFCGCMNREMDPWPDTDIANMQRALGAYTASFRAAKSNKTAAPERAPLVDKYIRSLSQCGGGDEFRQ
jgi:hypothetical protein